MATKPWKPFFSNVPLTTKSFTRMEKKSTHAFYLKSCVNEYFFFCFIFLTCKILGWVWEVELYFKPVHYICNLFIDTYYFHVRFETIHGALGWEGRNWKVNSNIKEHAFSFVIKKQEQLTGFYSYEYKKQLNIIA